MPRLYPTHSYFWQVSKIYKKEDEEKERESQGRAAGPWVPVDKAIMDYHN